MECAIVVFKFIREGNLKGALSAFDIFGKLRANIKEISTEDAAEDRQSLWSRLEEQLSKGKEGESAEKDDESDDKDVVSLLSSEDQFIHLQQLRKDLINILMKEIVHLHSRSCIHCT